MLIAAVVDEQLPAVSHFDIPVRTPPESVLLDGSDCSCATRADPAACREYGYHSCPEGGISCTATLVSMACNWHECDEI